MPSRRRCCCGGGGTCNITICASFCGTLYPGATVAISGGASGTTNSFGCVTLALGTTGTYTVTISKSGNPTFTGVYMLSCNTTQDISFLSIPVTVLDECGFPQVGLTVNMILGGTTVATGTTDGSGDVNLLLDGAFTTYDFTVVGGPCGDCTFSIPVSDCSEVDLAVQCTDVGFSTLTDANGTWPVNLSTGSRLVCYDVITANVCTGGTKSTSAISYFISNTVCVGDDKQVTVTRSWCTGFQFPDNCLNPEASCNSDSTYDCSPESNCTECTITLDYCTGTGSGTPTLSGSCTATPPVADPVGGTVVLA